MAREADPSTELIKVFRLHPERYFSVEELVREMASRGIELSQKRLRAILDALEGWRRIEKDESGGAVRYVYYDTMDFGCPRRRTGSGGLERSLR